MSVTSPSPAGRTRPLMRSPLRRRNLRGRVLAALSVALLVLVLAEPSATSLAAGGLLVLVGETLRLWATGFLVKTERLTLAGPYGFLRHPLYAGTLLIVSGLILAAGSGVAAFALPLGLAHFFLYYLPYKERTEARRLQARHGDAFADYRAAVPAILPRLTPWKAGGTGERWQLDRVVENDELGTAAAALIYLFALALKLL